LAVRLFCIVSDVSVALNYVPIDIAYCCAARPEFVNKTRNINATVGDTVTINCRTTGARPKPSIHWYRNTRAGNVLSTAYLWRATRGGQRVL